MKISKETYRNQQGNWSCNIDNYDSRGDGGLKWHDNHC